MSLLIIYLLDHRFNLQTGKIINGEKNTALRRKETKKAFAPLPVVFDVLTVCTVEKNFYTELENLLIHLTYLIINSFWKGLKC